MQIKDPANKKVVLFIIFLGLLLLFIGFFDSNGIDYYVIFLGGFFLVLGYFGLIWGKDMQEREKYKKIMIENVISSKLKSNERVENFFIGDYRHPYVFAHPFFFIIFPLYLSNVCFVFMTNKGMHFQGVSRCKENKLAKYMFYPYDDILSLKFNYDPPFGKMLTIVSINKKKICLNLKKESQFGFLEEGEIRNIINKYKE